MKANSPFIKIFSAIRKQSLFYFISHLLHKVGIKKYEMVAVEISSFCNVSCLWCWMHYSGKMDLGLMGFENFKKFIAMNAEFLSKNKIYISPFHRGESLLNADFFNMLDYAYERGVMIGPIDSNLSVEFDIRRLVNCHASRIIVNIGGTTKEIHEKVMRGSKFELVISNLKELLRLSKSNKHIYLKMNVTKHNFHQINGISDFLKKLGGRPQNAIVGATGFSQPAEASRGEIEEFFSNVVSDEIRDYLNFTYDEEKNISTKIKRCYFWGPTVKWDGKVSICCHDQLGRLNLGNAFRVPLSEILESRDYKTAEKKGRNREFYFCKNCN